ncbi:MAG: OmpA family protein, partial [Bacteroidetes bacterium]|nr:OmpA family protein [Bacteroidota bacterium]
MFSRIYYCCLVPILCIVLLVSATRSSAQPQEIADNLKAWQLKGYAKSATEKGDIYSALDYYLKYYERKPHKTKYLEIIADLYRETRDYNNALNSYEMLFEKDPDGYPMAQFYMAEMLHRKGEYDKAEDIYNKFKKEYKTNDSEFKKLLKAQTEGCELAKELVKKPLELMLNHLDTSVNKPHIDFAPLPLDDNTLLYASYRTNDIEYFNPEDTGYVPKVRKFYIAKKDEDRWKGGTPWDMPFNTDESDIGNGAFSPEGDKFYFTKIEKNWKNDIVTRIYVSYMEGGNWMEPVALPEPVNMSKYSSTMPTVGTESRKNNEILYFVSDRPDGKGGKDIWYAEWDKNSRTFEKVKNCGSKINTVADEITPYFDMKSRKMYFSSNGIPGMGGFDIFKTAGEATKWSEPENIGFPVNSGADDLYYVPGSTKETAFFVSNREGGESLRHPTCCDDIYSLLWSQYIKIEVTGNVYEIISDAKSRIPADSSDTHSTVALIQPDSVFRPSDSVVSITDTSNQKVLEKVKVSLYLLSDESSEAFFITTFKADSNEAYVLELEQGNNYKLIAERDEYFSDVAKISTKDITESATLRQDFVLEKIPRKAIILENIYYEYNKYNLTKDSKACLDSTLVILMKENPSIIVELSSHTDAIGKDGYNLKLSQRRAESVVNYLIEHGVDKERMVAKGYGETNPIAVNFNPDGSYNSEGQAMNRRTEFKVIGSSDPNSILNQGTLDVQYRKGDHTKTIRVE